MDPLRPVDFTHVKLEQGLLAQRQAVNATATLEANWTQCEKTGRLANFTRAAAKLKGEAAAKYEGYFFNDSDVYKMLEGAANILASLPAGPQRTSLDARIDGLIAQIAASQHADGYINGYFTLNEPDGIYSNLRDKHELYCAGHLMEAGVAHHAATGKKTLLDVASKLADQIERTFGPASANGRAGVCGHEEVELALFRLAAATGSAKYAALARYFVEQRGRADLFGATAAKPGTPREVWGEYFQDFAPVREHTRIVGHAVRSTYYYSAVTDLARTTSDSTLLAPLSRVWDDLTLTKMYVTGGIGSSGSNEGFTTSYDLPNDTAYAETCAGIGLVLWAHRLAMLHGTDTTVYMDVAERTLYNAVMSGVSLDGSRFFYDNPLSSRGKHHRQAWFGCACCPPNVLRLFSQLGGMVYATRGNDIIVNLYAAGTAQVATDQGTITVKQKTSYPWDGRITLSLDMGAPTTFTLYARIPAWSKTSYVSINGAEVKRQRADIGGTYAALEREWQAGDSVELVFDMTPRRMHANPAVKADRHQVALQRGPIVYCFEGLDQNVPLSSVAIPSTLKIVTRREEDLLGGVTLLDVPAFTRAPGATWQGSLYEQSTPQEVRLIAIPYFAWDNREACEMRVWMPESLASLPPRPDPTIHATASHCWAKDSVEAVADGQEPSSSADQTLPRLSFWDHQGTTEWVQYDFDQPRTVGGVQVYWFDDSPIGGDCRVPKGWRVQYRAGEGEPWKLLATRGQGKLDQFDEALFAPVIAKSVRLEVDLASDAQRKYSGGIHEWKVLK